MGGHGALVVGLRNPDLFTAISAFAPIVNPIACPWGQKAFSGYLGKDQSLWQEYDATYLLSRSQKQIPILIDQLRQAGRIDRQSVNMLVGFGVGLSWAGCLWKDLAGGHHGE